MTPGTLLRRPPDPTQLGTQPFLLYHGGSVIVTCRQQAEMLPALRNAAEALC